MAATRWSMSAARFLPQRDRKDRDQGSRTPYSITVNHATNSAHFSHRTPCPAVVPCAILFGCCNCHCDNVVAQE